jgi:hypothetical protein
MPEVQTGGLELGVVRVVQFECSTEPHDRVGMRRSARTTLKVRDAVRAKPSTLGEFLLAEPGRGSMASQ